MDNKTDILPDELMILIFHNLQDPWSYFTVCKKWYSLLTDKKLITKYQRYIDILPPQLLKNFGIVHTKGKKSQSCYRYMQLDAEKQKNGISVQWYHTHRIANVRLFDHGSLILQLVYTYLHEKVVAVKGYQLYLMDNPDLSHVNKIETSWAEKRKHYVFDKRLQTPNVSILTETFAVDIEDCGDIVIVADNRNKKKYVITTNNLLFYEW